MSARNFRKRPALAEYAGAQTDAVVVAAPPAGFRVEVDLFVVNSDVAGAFFFESGATVVYPRTTLPASGGAAIDYPKLEMAAATALTFTSTFAGNHSVFVLSHLERV